MNRINITFSSLSKTTWTLIYQFVKSIVYDPDLRSKGDSFTKLQSVASRIMIEDDPVSDAKTGDGVDLSLNQLRSLSKDTCFGLIYQNSSDDEDFTGLVPFILLQHEFKDAISLGIDIGLLESSKHSSFSFKCGNFFYLIENNPPKLGKNSIYIINEIKKIDKSLGVIKYVSPTNRISRLKGKGDSGYSGAPSRRFLPLIKITESTFRSIFVKNESSDEKNKLCDSTDLSFILESINKIKQNLESNKAIKPIWPYLKEIFEESQSPFEQWLESGYFYSLGDDLKNPSSEKIEGVRKTLQIYKNSVIELVQNIIFHAGKEGILYCVFDEKNNVKKEYGESILDFDTYKDNTRFLRIGVFDYSENGIVDTFCNYLKTNPYPDASEDINSLSLRSFFDTKSIVAKGLTLLEMRYAARLGIKTFVKTIINHKGFFSVESNCHNNNCIGKKHIQTVLNNNVITLSPEEESVFVKGTHYEIVLPIVANEDDKITPVQSDSLMSNSYFHVTNEKKTTFSWLIRDISDFDFKLISSSTNKKEQIDKIRKVGDKVIDEVNQKDKNYDGIVWNFEGEELDFNIVFKLVSFLQLKYKTGFKRIILANTTEHFIKGLYDLLNELIIDKNPVWSKNSAIIVYSENMYSMILWGETKDELYYINQESQRFNYNYFFQESSIIDWNSNSVQESIDNNTKESVKQFVLPYDILINAGKEKHESIFECFLNKLLKRKINPNNLGFLVNHENTYIGNKIIVKNYYEADMMFQNNFFTDRFAYMIAQNIKNEIIFKNQQNNKLVLIGYDHYSEVLLKSIEKWLKPKDDKSSVINDVILAIFIEEKETFANDNDYDFDFDIDKKQNVENDILNNSEEFLFATIVPIGSTLSTNDKIIARFRQRYRSKKIKNNKKEGDYSLLFLLEDERFIYNHCVIVVRDSDGAVVSVQEKGQRWESIDLSKRIIGTGFTNAKEIHYSTLVAKTTRKDKNKSNWAKRLNNEISFKEDWWREEYVNYTENSSINSQNLMGFPRIVTSELNEESHNVELDRLFDLKDDIYKGHIEVLNCHHKYYIDTEKFVKRNNAKLDNWLQNEVETGMLDQSCINVIITPNVERESDFIFKVKESIFNGNALIIYLDVNNWRNNMVHKLSYLKEIEETNVKFHYVDQAFLSGETYHKSKSYLFSILENTTVSFASIITVVNRLSYAKNIEIQNDVRGKFFSFIKLHYPGSKEGEHDCELCQLDKYYKNLSTRTVLDSCNDAIIKNSKKLIIVQKNKKDSKQCSKRGFIRLVLTHEIYYRIAEIVQQYSKAYNYGSIYIDMESELNGIFEQLSQNRPLPEQEKEPKSKINQKIDNWLTLKCKDIQDELSGELNAVFMEKLRVDKKISFLKVISSPPLSKYIAIRKYAHEKLLNELHLMISRTNNKQNDFVYDDLKLIKSILKSLSFLKSNALVRKDVIIGVWRVLGKVLCNLEEEKYKIEEYLRVIEKRSNEIKNIISQRNSLHQQSLNFSDYSDENINNDIRKLEVLKSELEKDLGRLKEDEIIRDFSQDVQFFVKNAIVEDDAKSTFLGELLRRGKEMDVFENIAINKTRLLLRTIEKDDFECDDKKTGFWGAQRDENNDLFGCFYSEYDKPFKSNENYFLDTLKSKRRFQREYNSFLVWLFYDNTTIIRKTLRNFVKDLENNYWDVLYNKDGILNEFKVFKERVEMKKGTFIENVIQKEYYYSSFIPYLLNGDEIDYVGRLLYVTYAKQKLNDLTANKHKTNIENDMRDLMEIFVAIMGADAAFWTMKKEIDKQNVKINNALNGVESKGGTSISDTPKKKLKDFRVYPISIYDLSKKNQWDYDNYIFSNDSYYSYQIYTQKVLPYPLIPSYSINPLKGEKKDLGMHSLGIYTISESIEDDDLKSTKKNTVSCITFLYKESNCLVSDEIQFRIHFLESGRLLLLLKKEIDKYVVDYLIQEKVFELWEKVHLSSRRFAKIYANSSHVFNSVYKEMDEFEALDEKTIMTLSKTWFTLTNETISFLYSTIEQNPIHNLSRLEEDFIQEPKNTLGVTFNTTFISILRALLHTRWKAEQEGLKNEIYINGKKIDEYSIEDKYKNVTILCNKHIIRTLIAQCLNNSLFSKAGGRGHRYQNEIKRVDIFITKSKITIKDSSFYLGDDVRKEELKEEKNDDARRFYKKKKYIKNMMCDDYSSTTLTTLQGVANYFHFSCDFGYRGNDFEVSIIFKNNKNDGNKDFDY